jgi:hypothetical protein
MVLALLLIIGAVGAWYVALSYAIFERRWFKADYPCFVAYDGVVCNQTFVVALGDPLWLQSEVPSKATTPIYAGAALFVLLVLLTLAIHQWRLATVGHGALYKQPPPAESSPTPVAPLRAADAPAPAAADSDESWARALALGALQLARQPLSYVWRDWAQPSITGALVGAAMAFYQVLLQCVMCAVWGSSFVNEVGSLDLRSTKAIAVVAIPALLLCASGLLQSYLKCGNAAQFVASVNYNWRVAADQTVPALKLSNECLRSPCASVCLSVCLCASGTSTPSVGSSSRRTAHTALALPSHAPDQCTLID